jgi:hypothetical protein
MGWDYGRTMAVSAYSRGEKVRSSCLAQVCALGNAQLKDDADAHTT